MTLQSRGLLWCVRKLQPDFQHGVTIIRRWTADYTTCSSWPAGCQYIRNIQQMPHSARPFKSHIRYFHRRLSLCASDENFSVSSGQIDLKPSRTAKHRITAPTRPVHASDNKPRESSQAENTGGETSFAAGIDLLSLERDAKRDTLGRHQYKKQQFYPKEGKRKKWQKEAVEVQGEILYGRFPVLMALQERKRDFYRIYIKDGSTLENPVLDQIVDLAEEEGVTVDYVALHTLGTLVRDSMQGLRQHQGVCADVSKLSYRDPDVQSIRDDLAESIEDHPRIWLALDSIQDPNNFGAVIRSAYFLGVERILAHNSCKLSAAVSKVSAGVLEVVPLHRVSSLKTLIELCQESGWQALGTTGMQGDENVTVTALREVKVTKNTLLVLGNEGEGLSEGVSGLCDSLVRVESGRTLHPMLDSLNVSVATGILLHHLTSTR